MSFHTAFSWTSASRPWRLAALWRTQLRASEAWLTLLAVAVGSVAGSVTVLLGWAAHRLQQSLFDLPPQSHLSATPALPFGALLLLPVGGLVVGLTTKLSLRRHTPVDVVEANALLGGRLPWRDSVIITIQTLLSNGTGASVGLEAAYAQCGGTVGSLIGSRLRLRRNDLRILVGAGTAAAISAAFGAPLAGAFYGFEIVIGAYTPAALAPVAAASLAGALVARAVGAPPYLVAVTGGSVITLADYLLYAGLGGLSALAGITLMRATASVDRLVRSALAAPWLRPAVGGALLMPLAYLSPQTISAGHGALNIDIAARLGAGFIAMVFILKSAASIVSLGFGYRGGLFFASLLLGSLFGELFAMAMGAVGVTPLLNPADAALVGMAAFATAVIGGPMTMSILVLEATHDFDITAVVVAATLVASVIAREQFGYSFSTWRLHLRGETVRSARDIGWVRSITAGDLMRRDALLAPATLDIRAFRDQFPPSAASRVVLVDGDQRYVGIVVPATAFDPSLDGSASVSRLAVNRGAVLTTAMDIKGVMAAFDDNEADELAVVDDDRRVIGIVTEKYVRRRYADELDRAQRALFGER